MSNTGNLLSAEEIDALTAGINEGSVRVDTGYNTNASVKKHDLTNEDSSLGVSLSALDMVNERFIRLLRLGLMEVLRSTPRLSPSRIQLMKYGQYLDGKQPPLSVSVVRMSPLRGSNMVLMDTNVIFTTLDTFFGGTGQSIGHLAQGRLFTPTETRVINLMLDVVFHAMQQAWAPLLELDVERISTEVNPHFAQIADEHDLVIVNHFDAECANCKGYVDIVYPYSALKPIRDLLKRNRVHAEDNKMNQQWHTQLVSALGDAELELRVVLGNLQVPLSELSNMKDGDILYFKKPDYAKVIINGIPAFEAQVGTSGPNVAIQIEKILETSNS